MTDVVGTERLGELVGERIGISEWITVDQSRIDGFAEVTEDRQFIHVDPLAAADGPFGCTVAHGFLSLSLLGGFGAEVLPRVLGPRLMLNYGLDRVRFLAPVRVGRRVRGIFVLRSLAERAADRLLAAVEVTIEIEGETKPALVAEWMILLDADRG